jgi:ATP-dependent DNA ligase
MMVSAWLRKSGAARLRSTAATASCVSHSYIEVARALKGVKSDAVIDGELVAIGADGASHFQLLQNALRHEARADSDQTRS